MQLSGKTKCIGCAKNIIKTEGYIALYRSLPITLLMNAPYSITTVIVNENMKKIVEPNKRTYKFLSYFYCAAFAGATASLITLPLDNIKTKLQTQTVESTCDKMMNDFNLNKECNLKDIENNSNSNKVLSETSSKVEYKSVLQTAKHIYIKDGIINGFFRGLSPRIICNAPSCAISWGSYEMMKHFLVSFNSSNSNSNISSNKI